LDKGVIRNPQLPHGVTSKLELKGEFPAEEHTKLGFGLYWAIMV